MYTGDCLVSIWNIKHFSLWSEKYAIRNGDTWYVIKISSYKNIYFLYVIATKLFLSNASNACQSLNELG